MSSLRTFYVKCNNVKIIVVITMLTEVMTESKSHYALPIMKEVFMHSTPS